MAAETPAPVAPRRRRGWIVVVVAAVAVAGCGLAAIHFLRHSPHRPPARVVVAAPVSRTTTPPSSAPSSVPPTSPRAVPHDVVAAGAPSSFTYAGRGYTVRARVCGMAYVRPLDPPGEQHHTVCWVQHGFGTAPGSNSATTYVLGHAWAPDPREVLNRVSSTATYDVLHGRAQLQGGVAIYPVRSLVGDRIVLRTSHGTLTYTVRTAYGVRKAAAGDYAHLMDERIHNRVVLITCAERHGRDYDYNIVVEAYLTSARRLPDRT